MAGLKVFVSSTCVDLDAYRFQIRGLLERMGYEPIMSDHSEVLYDPSLHTHASCLRDVQSADVVILLIGSRFGGETASQALPLIDFDQALKSSSSVALLSEPNKVSITQAEALQASNNDIPIFTFVDSKVYSDHYLYQANKESPNISQIRFPSIAKQETAKNIFEFINFLTHRSFNNAIITFQSFSEIENHLLKQWSLLFQRLLQERKDKATDNKKSIDIAGRIDELKSAVLQAMPKGRERDVARSVVRHRRMSDFLYRIESALEVNLFKDFKGDYSELLNAYGIRDFIWDTKRGSPYYALAIMKDGGFIGCFNYTDNEAKEFKDDWRDFLYLDDEIKGAVAEVASEFGLEAEPFERHIESVKEYHDNLDIESNEDPPIMRRMVRRQD